MFVLIQLLKKLVSTIIEVKLSAHLNQRIKLTVECGLQISNTFNAFFKKNLQLVILAEFCTNKLAYVSLDLNLQISTAKEKVCVCGLWFHFINVSVIALISPFVILLK